MLRVKSKWGRLGHSGAVFLLLASLLGSAVWLLLPARESAAGPKAEERR